MHPRGVMNGVQSTLFASSVTISAVRLYLPLCQGLREHFDGKDPGAPKCFFLLANRRGTVDDILDAQMAMEIVALCCVQENTAVACNY